MTRQERPTEQIILKTATEIFIRKGYNGARMQEIADAAGMNKALLHYYFKDKDHLFNAVFKNVIADIFPSVFPILDEDLPFTEKIVRFIHTYIDQLISHPHLPEFVFHEINVNPLRFSNTIQNFGFDFSRITRQINAEINTGKIRAFKPEHLLVNLISLCIFPFIAQNVVKGLLKMDDKDLVNFLESRKSEVVNFFLQSITIEKSTG